MCVHLPQTRAIAHPCIAPALVHTPPHPPFVCMPCCLTLAMVPWSPHMPSPSVFNMHAHTRTLVVDALDCGKECHRYVVRSLISSSRSHPLSHALPPAPSLHLLVRTPVHTTILHARSLVAVLHALSRTAISCLVHYPGACAHPPTSVSHPQAHPLLYSVPFTAMMQHHALMPVTHARHACCVCRTSVPPLALMPVMPLVPLLMPSAVDHPYRAHIY
ncbi:hypothetical protein EVG20_g11354 [Dentipellis fragilis]|uniref:Uncharacterized protein n=1 Tax=Dentipellis fragilis TaxID=205917 RepID=A0A4Y9XL24_9AGAM|nr:hypothetical protein EVG20_g11354 [Dentipellis fragilis]